MKERFFDFIFEAEEFISSDFHQKMLHYEKIFRDNITEAIEKDDQDTVEDDDDDEKEIKANCKGCLKERFFDFIFEAEEFISSDFHQKMLHYEKIFRDNITEAIEKDESNKPEDVDEMIYDVEHLRLMKMEMFASSTVVKEKSTVSLTWQMFYLIKRFVFI